MSSRGETGAAHILIPEMTLRDALVTAMEFERAARRFYTELADRVEPHARELVLELAAEEEHHYNLLKELSLRQDIESELESTATDVPTAENFEAYISLPNLTDGSTEDEILEYAESREQIAHEHYGYLAETTGTGPLRELFAFLRDEERKHATMVQSRWSTLFSIL